MTGDQPAMQITMDLTGMGTPTDMRMVDGVMYIQDPARQRQVPQDGPQRPERPPSGSRRRA